MADARPFWSYGLALGRLGSRPRQTLQVCRFELYRHRPADEIHRDDHYRLALLANNNALEILQRPATYANPFACAEERMGLRSPDTQRVLQRLHLALRHWHGTALRADDLYYAGNVHDSEPFPEVDLHEQVRREQREFDGCTVATPKPRRSVSRKERPDCSLFQLRRNCLLVPRTGIHNEPLGR